MAHVGKDITMKSLFEELGGTYHREGDYLIPDLVLPDEDKRPIGIWVSGMNAG